MPSQKVAIDSDLTNWSVADAAGVLGVMPKELTILCPTSVSAEAQSIQQKYGCQVVLIPTEIMAGSDVWAVGYQNYFVWSPGA